MGRAQVGLTPEQQAAHGQLMGIVAGHLHNGQTVPCVTSRHRDAWTSADPAHQEFAAAQCLSCPALRACTEYITAFNEPAGTWAGLLATERNQK